MPKILIQKKKKEFVEELKREVITRKSKKYYITNINQDYSVSGDSISKKELKKNGEKIKSSHGKEFIVFDSTFVDDYKKIKRMPQTIPLKDVGLILAETGINKNSKVLDSGTGSGALTCMLANFVKEVISYDIRDDHLNVAEENVKTLNLKNITLKKKDITEGIDGDDFDLITLDVPEPWKVVKHCAKSLKVGAFLVCYSITTPQLQDFVAELAKEERLLCVKTVELIEREWNVEDRIVKPKTISIGHSGFLTFVRKILK